jgi:hypothetical protein
MNDHSPLPWRHEIDGPFGDRLVDARGLSIFVPSDPSERVHDDDLVIYCSDGNYELIVAAVNVREDLLAACEAALKRFVDYEMDVDCSPPEHHRKFMSQLKAAIAKAKIAKAPRREDAKKKER